MQNRLGIVVVSRPD